MTLYDLRNDLGTYSGIAIMCPQCGGPFPVEAFIRTEQCPLCDSTLDLEMSVLDSVDTDETEEMDVDDGQEAEMDIVVETPRGETQEDYFSPVNLNE